jgi:Tfp pilus assembly protein PilO
MSETQRQLLIATLIFGVLAFGGVAYYYYGFAKETIENTQKKIEKVEKEIKEIKRELDEYNEFLEIRDQVETLVQTIADASTRLPTENDDRHYVGKMRDFVAKTGVEMEALEKQKTDSYPDWLEFPHIVSGQTRYTDFVQFLSLAEQNTEYFMRVKAFNLSNDTRSNNPTVHPFELSLSSFVFKN